MGIKWKADWRPPGQLGRYLTRMTMTPDQTEKLAQQTLETARNSGAKKAMLAGSGIVSLTRLSITSECRSGDLTTRPDAIDYLRSRDVGCLVRRLETLNNALYRSFIESHGAPGAAVENDIDAVHVAWLVDEWVPANSFLAVCADDFVRKVYPVTRFWAEYYRAVQSLASRVAYDPVMQKACGYERYLIPYLYLIADLTNSAMRALRVPKSLNCSPNETATND